MQLPDGAHCATNQVLYHAGSRGIEFDLLPWCSEHKMPLMAYSPVGQGGSLLRSKALAAVAKRHNATPAQIAIAWTMRHDNVITIPKASDQQHVRENAAAGAIVLTAEDSRRSTPRIRRRDASSRSTFPKPHISAASANRAVSREVLVLTLLAVTAAILVGLGCRRVAAAIASPHCRRCPVRVVVVLAALGLGDAAALELLIGPGG